MKLCTKNLFLVPGLIVALGLILAGRVTAQTFTTLHSFTALGYTSGVYTNEDGGSPRDNLILSGSLLYGTAYYGGSFGWGTVFAINTNGAGFTNLHRFTGGIPPGNPTDGGNPGAGLILSGSTLYGTTLDGGIVGEGTLFAVNNEGMSFTTLHSFVNSDGSQPKAGLILSGDTLYGTASGIYGGAATVFKVNTNGTGFTNLHNFTGGSDGSQPVAGLILSGDTLFGTAAVGGNVGGGTVFAINTNGTGFTNLHGFAALPPPYTGTNSEGANPGAGLVLSGNTLYGTAGYGGSSANGTVFAVNTDGTRFSILYSFTAASGSFPNMTNSDGAYPQAGLISSGNILYGTTPYGGASGGGTVFAINTDGTGFRNLHSFTGGSDGANPFAGLILSGNTLYGTASSGGSSGSGTVFSIFIQPQLTLIPSGPYVILTWPTNYVGFNLQSTTNLSASAIWATVTPGPVTIGEQNIVINTKSGTQQFYRLSQ